MPHLKSLNAKWYDYMPPGVYRLVRSTSLENPQIENYRQRYEGNGKNTNTMRNLLIGAATGAGVAYLGHKAYKAYKNRQQQQATENA